MYGKRSTLSNLVLHFSRDRFPTTTTTTLLTSEATPPAGNRPLPYKIERKIDGIFAVINKIIQIETKYDKI